MRNTNYKSEQAGFSLIELMVAMLIGLIVLNGVVQLFINSKRSYLDNQAISQIQENARFSIDILSRELRVAGYVGCMPINNGDIDASRLVGKQDELLVDGDGNFSSIEIFNDVTNGSEVLPAQIRADVQSGTDVLIVRHTDPDQEWVLEQDLATTNGAVSVTTGKQISKGAPVALVSHDCAVANLVQISEATGSAITLANANGSFQFNSFKKGSRVSPLVAYAYYIGESSVIDNVPALKRERLTVSAGGAIESRSEELAIGVSDLQLQIGTIAAGAVSFENVAGASVANDASAVRVSLQMRSHQAVNPPTETDPDGFVFKDAVATVRVRNQG